MPSTRNARTATYGTGATAVTAVNVGEGQSHIVLFQTFAAAGASAGVPMPGGASSAIVQSATFGAPTSATVVAEGSTDGANWYQLPAPGFPSTLPNPFTQVRLRCTALTGGTSPSIVACAIVNP